MIQHLTSPAAGYIAFSTPLFVAGSYCLKRYADEGSGFAGLTAAFFFLGANLAYARLLGIGLSTGFLASSIACAVLTMGVAVVAFGEPFGRREGIALASLILAAVTLAQPEGGRA